MNLRSISFRLVIWYASFLTAIFLLLGALLYFDLRHFLENDLRAAQARRTHQIANTLLVHVRQIGEAHAVYEVADWYEPEINDRFIRITRGDGTVIYVSGELKDGAFDPNDVSTLRPSSKTEFSQKIKLSNGKTLLVAAMNFKSPGNPTYLIEFGELLNPVETMLNRLFLQLALGLPLAIFVIAGGGWLLVRRALKPVEHITHAAEHITQHNLSERLPVAHTGDELENLSLALNRMITRLDDAFQNSKRFVADASHELRTPLTILHGEIETLAQDARLDSELRERAASLLEEVMRLTRIVEQLFALSRLDAGESQTEWKRFDLAELAKTTTEQMNLLAEDKKIEMVCDANRPVLIEGDRARLKQVVVNLLDNAIKYTPANGAIQLSVNAVNGHAILEVADNGIGISSEALPHVFERFFRVDPSRSNADSAGLGLSIVKSICTAHGAEIEAESAPRHGSCFRVKFPLPKN